MPLNNLVAKILNNYLNKLNPDMYTGIHYDLESSS